MPRRPPTTRFDACVMPRSSQASPADLPTPPEEPSSSVSLPTWTASDFLKPRVALNGGSRQDIVMEDEPESSVSRPCEVMRTGYVVKNHDPFAQLPRSHGFEQEKPEARDLASCYASGHTSLVDQMVQERAMWRAHYEALRLDNEHLRHVAYVNALHQPADGRTIAASPADRSDTRNLRQQLACANEQFQSLTDNMTRLQDQMAEAYRLLAQERQERMEERNNQLTVVVAKHGLERRMRNREQDLQTEWRRNAELSERCQRLEEELAQAREGRAQVHSFEIPLRSKEPPAASPPRQDTTIEDEWDDTPSHVPPDFGYSKFVRWKKRTRGGHDHGGGKGRKQRRTTLEAAELQLAGSESPPQVEVETPQAGPGASAIDHMIAGEFVDMDSAQPGATQESGFAAR